RGITHGDGKGAGGDGGDHRPLRRLRGSPRPHGATAARSGRGGASLVGVAVQEPRPRDRDVPHEGDDATSKHDRKVERRYEALTPAARLGAGLAAVWEDRDPDPLILRARPMEQTRQYNGLLDRVRHLNLQLDSYILVVWLEAERLRERWA